MPPHDPSIVHSQTTIHTNLPLSSLLLSTPVFFPLPPRPAGFPFRQTHLLLSLPILVLRCCRFVHCLDHFRYSTRDAHSFFVQILTYPPEIERICVVPSLLLSGNLTSPRESDGISSPSSTKSPWIAPG